jgi:hypothetical protein
MKVVEKIKTHILCSIKFFRKYYGLWDNVEKYGRARQATDDNIIRRMRFPWWITKARHTLRIYNTYCFPTEKMGKKQLHFCTQIRGPLSHWFGELAVHLYVLESRTTLFLPEIRQPSLSHCINSAISSASVIFPKIKYLNWIEVAQDRIQCRVL